MPWKVLLRGLLVMALLALAGWLINAAMEAGLLSRTWVDTQVRGHGLAGEALFVAVGAVATALAVPRQAVAFMGGYAFGTWAGTAWSVAAATLGCALGFYFARRLARPMVARWLSGRMRTLDAFLSGHPFTMTLLIRLLPVGSNALTNLAGGLSSARALPFLAGSALGYVPQTLVFALLGSGVSVGAHERTLLAVGLFAASALLGVALYRRFRHGQSFDDKVDATLRDDA
jgi:uncharacterized membrane protein YdjX (TVP38/TMEM64 family)